MEVLMFCIVKDLSCLPGFSVKAFHLCANDGQRQTCKPQNQIQLLSVDILSIGHWSWDGGYLWNMNIHTILVMNFYNYNSLPTLHSFANGRILSQHSIWETTTTLCS